MTSPHLPIKKKDKTKQTNKQKRPNVFRDSNLVADLRSSSLTPGTEGFTCGKWFIGYNFGIEDDAELKFGTHKELIILNILKCKHCVTRYVTWPFC